MCGRFTLTQPAYIAAKFGLDNFAPVEPEFYEPRFNVAPTQRIVVIPTIDGQRDPYVLTGSMRAPATAGTQRQRSRVCGLVADGFDARLARVRCRERAQ